MVAWWLLLATVALHFPTSLSPMQLLVWSSVVSDLLAMRSLGSVATSPPPYRHLGELVLSLLEHFLWVPTPYPQFRNLLPLLVKP
jgi:hypothetical protein